MDTTSATSGRFVHALYAKKLESSGLTLNDGKILCFEPLTPEQTNELEITQKAAGFLIPYFKLDGSFSGFWRYRYLQASVNGFAKASGAKDKRYVQAPNTLNELYLPPLKVNWPAIAADPAQRLYITEGELKAACACKHGFPTIGLGGVDCFKSTKRELQLLPGFAEFAWKERDVYIAYDSDASSNARVIRAENALARELTKLGARVFIVRIESENEIKVGLDDLITIAGPQALSKYIEQAEAWGESKELHQMNEEVVFIQNPVMVCKLDTFQLLKTSDFANAVYANRRYTEYVTTEKTVKAVVRYTAKEWLKWEHRSEVSALTYAPGASAITERGELNTWRGMGLAPKKGNLAPWRAYWAVLTAGMKPEHAKWFEQWLAYPLQHLGTKMFSAVAIWSRHTGNGKSLLGFTMGKLYGPNFYRVEARQLKSNFNEWSRDRQFILGDEITGSDKREDADNLKNLIARTEVAINPKGVSEFTVPDCINYYLTSQHPDAFFLDETDRRFFIHELREAAQPDEFFTAFIDWRDNQGGAAALYYYLLSVDLEGFNPSARPPMTSAKVEMIQQGQSNLGAWVHQLRMDPGSVLQTMDGTPSPHDLWTLKELMLMYDPQERGRAGVKGLSNALAVSGIQKLNEGMGVRTWRGQLHLYAVRNEARYLKMSGVELAKAYDAQFEGLRGGQPDKEKQKREKF